MHTASYFDEKPLRVYTLGRFEIEQGARVIESQHWRSLRASSLFKILLNRRNFQAGRQEVAELLWPELDSDRAANNLHQAVYQLRRLLEPDLEKVGASVYLKSEGTKLQLNPALVEWVDFKEFQRVCQQARLGNNAALYEQAAALYNGEYLPNDLYENWAIYQREILQQEWINLLFEMSELYQAQGQIDRYLQCLHRILEADFSQEKAVQLLMRSLAESRRNQESLSLYHNFADKLRQRLNIEPLPETRDLQQQIARGFSSPASVPSPVPAFLALEAAPNFNLTKISSAKNSPVLRPEPVTGRKFEQQVWQQKLEIGQGSFTILLGEAGIGKSCLLDFLAQRSLESGFEVIRVNCGIETEARFFDIFNEILNRLSRKRPLVLALDNLELLPAQALRLLESLLDNPQTAALLVIAALPSNSSEVGRYAELSQLVHRVMKQPQAIWRLTRLAKSEIGEMLAQSLGQKPNPALVETIYQMAQGNPRLTLELLEGWRECQLLILHENQWQLMGEESGSQLPATLIGYIRQAIISRLSQPAQILLKLAALIGPCFGFQILREIVLYRNDGAGWWIELDKTQLGPALLEITECDLVQEQGENFYFKYPLLMETLCASLSYNQRLCWQEVIEWAKHRKKGKTPIEKNPTYAKV